jgi:hypothetical protein
MSSNELTDQPPRRSAIVFNSCDERARNTTPFWTAGVQVGINLILSQLDDIDHLSRRIRAMPPSAGARREAVDDYLGTIGQLADAWLDTSRPALLQALRGLRAFAERLMHIDAGQLEGEPHPASIRLLDDMTVRVGDSAGLLERLNLALGGHLERMALASGDLETDTVLVTQRLQADQVHAAMLSQQLDTLRERIGDARQRQHGHWPLGSQAEQLRREIATQNAALDSARRQLERIRACQAVTLAEAAYLQQLLPTLSGYLAGVDRMGAGIDTAVLGLRALQSRLRELLALQLAGRGALQRADLDAALPHWRQLAARLGDALGRTAA